MPGAARTAIGITENAGAVDPARFANMPGVRQFGAPKLPDLKAFNGNIGAFARSEAYAAIDQLRGRRAA